MSAPRYRQYAPFTPSRAPELYANFLALTEQGQAFKAENEDWNRKKAHTPPPRRWSKKRVLVPPGAKAKPLRQSGAQPYNTNRLRHGKFTREWQLFRGEIRSEIRASHALIAYAYAVHSAPAKPAEAAPQNSA
ncbi:MAG: hypothetical protein P4L57_06905 [Rhizomicrobium sp.]|nr:hypothetical protein [Rhizomicrobium sp.]